MNLAIIPARGGSKRIPRKNIKPFMGRPIMAYSIENALKCECFDRVIVSTDDAEIASVAREWGAETPFVRPVNLADDHVGTIDVIKHAIEWVAEQDEIPNRVCCIYATAPFLRADFLTEGLETLVASGTDYAVSMTSFPFPIQRAVMLSSDLRMTMFQPECFQARSQDLEEAYHDAGQFYWGRRESFLQKKPFFSQDSSAVLLPRYRVVDIDTPEDWVRAELMYKLLTELGEL